MLAEFPLVIREVLAALSCPLGQVEEHPWYGQKAYDEELTHLWKSADGGDLNGVRQALSTLQSYASSPLLAQINKLVSIAIIECS